MTVHRASSLISLTMNRDEVLTRGPEVPPAVYRAEGGPAWMGPRDSDRGGTWIGVNEWGVTACLHNAYLPGESLAPDPGTPYRSRGEIIPELLRRGEFAAAVDWLEHGMEPGRYPSFSLYVIGREGGNQFHWRRREGLEVGPIEGEWNVFSSSGWDSAEVIAWRERAFRDWLRGGRVMRGPLPVFHLVQEPGHEERSPLMRRSWSATRSVTQVDVDFDHGRITMRYWPDPTPATDGPSSLLQMAVKRAAARRAG